MPAAHGQACFLVWRLDDSRIQSQHWTTDPTNGTDCVLKNCCACANMTSTSEPDCGGLV
jgi:hypothetical protein